MARDGGDIGPGMSPAVVVRQEGGSKSNDLIYAKVSSMFALGLAALACALIPIIIASVARRRGLKSVGAGRGWFLELFLRWGGGILLATTFLHLLPEVREGIERLGLEDAWPIQIPELVTVLGFFLMYLIEELAHIALHSHHNHSHHDHSHQHDHQTEGDGGGHSHLVGGGPPVRGLLIVVALSVHQIFEGMAIGLETSPPHVWVLLGAVAAHKLVIAVCVGAEIASAGLTILRATLCVGVFAIASPIGIGIGLGLSASTDEDNKDLNTVSVVLQGLATGTLLYVVFFEVLLKTTGGPKYQGLAYCFATFIGFAVMLVLLIFFNS